MATFSHEKSIVVNRTGAGSVIKAFEHKTTRSLKDIPNVKEIDTSELKKILEKFL